MRRHSQKVDEAFLGRRGELDARTESDEARKISRGDDSLVFTTIHLCPSGQINRVNPRKPPRQIIHRSLALLVLPNRTRSSNIAMLCTEQTPKSVNMPAKVSGTPCCCPRFHPHSVPLTMKFVLNYSLTGVRNFLTVPSHFPSSVI